MNSHWGHTLLQQPSAIPFFHFENIGWIFPTVKSVLVLTRETHPDVVLAQTLPEAVALGIDGNDHVVDRLGDRVLPFQVHPCGEVHDAL